MPTILPDLPRPQGSPFRVFDFPMDLTTQDPTNYSPAAVVQLFYLCNWYHDKLYELGFTEAAGNFQSNNFARGGLGNDAVQADAQDGSGTDNANFSTPPDGSPGRMQMYIFTSPSPRRDGDLDAEVVLHEHTHGLSWRLVGGGQGLGRHAVRRHGRGMVGFLRAGAAERGGRRRERQLCRRRVCQLQDRRGKRHCRIITLASGAIPTRRT